MKQDHSFTGLREGNTELDIHIGELISKDIQGNLKIYTIHLYLFTTIELGTGTDR